MSRSRSWIFTLNNYTSDDETTLQSLDCRYIIYGREIAPTTGTPHLQGYVYFNEAKTLSSVKKKISKTAHLEIPQGTATQNREYCSKDKDFFEKGIIPDQNDKNGKTKLTPASKFSDCTTLAQYKWLQTLKTQTIQSRTEKPTVLWFHGPTGTGKSKLAYSYPDVYPKNETKWWDGYYGQQTIVIDDFEKNTYWTFRTLLKVIDRYPFLVEYKGGTLQLNSPTIIITSEHPPEHYTETKTEYQQLIRRIDKVEDFSKKKILD